ncbi:hypothetical protein CspeluHIS016_0902800 [Cutaneotrichosporon spelunceum]|uniref:Uncharacterized protein n=1 Tax=Cutaneotrichosporon spelunceum TaxID=1672016 RepID=A0AAD3U097_9TREE|nr:hypothetical protein CspeluHIS016_0902800 [Cutaneotrichosporon spelunceum]
MDALVTAAGAIRLAAALYLHSMTTRAWYLDPSVLVMAVGHMQKSADGFTLGILVPILLAMLAAMRFRQGLEEAGVASVGGPLCLFAVAVPLQIVAVHVAALDVVAGRGWARVAGE